jgi:hypothetical protein
VSLADLTLTCSEGAIYLHDVELTEDEFTFLARIADLFRANDEGGYTPALLVMRAPNEPTEYCDDCGQNRPERKKETDE